MKTLIILMTSLFLTNTVSAATGTRQDIVRTPLSAEITSVVALCPANVVCITDGTVVHLKFQLVSSCGALVMKYTIDEASNTVNIQAVEQVNAKQACIAVVPEPVMESVTLVMMSAPLTVNFIGTDVSYEILPQDVTR